MDDLEHICVNERDFAQFDKFLLSVRKQQGEVDNRNAHKEQAETDPLAEVAQSSTFDLRGLIGQRFAKQHKKDSKPWQEYHACACTEAKRKFRAECVAKGYKRREESRTQEHLGSE